MVLTKRERTIALAALITAAVLALDRIVFSPLLARLDKLHADEKLYTDQLTNANALFQRHEAKQARWDGMVADGLKSDAADTEDALDHAVYEWAQASGLSLKWCTPERPSQKDRSEVVLYVAGTGRMSAVAQFLFRAQTSKLPVRPEDVEIATRREGTDDLTLTLHLSGLYFPADGKAASAGAASVSGGTRK
jgi:hypothetical protein